MSVYSLCSHLQFQVIGAPSGYDGDPYFPEASITVYCAPVPPPVPQPFAFQKKIIAFAIAISSHGKVTGFQNLPTDDYLMCHMDEQGWVHVGLIAAFPRMRLLENSISCLQRGRDEPAEDDEFLEICCIMFLALHSHWGPHQVMPLHLKLNSELDNLRPESVPKVLMFQNFHNGLLLKLIIMVVI
ncbi:hypothetical protein HHK36_007770 [Tetracentron sinense]|uniref:HTH La-type RNA-binding domain-containing protein n=1 Tax=Tetracentron sinense TaxID=13715 RepID=A0A835DIP6_TETSI|nr:hypothetical protein HHK36_007770 [Tetracentron sinense]